MEIHLFGVLLVQAMTLAVFTWSRDCLGNDTRESYMRSSHPCVAHLARLDLNTRIG